MRTQASQSAKQFARTRTYPRVRMNAQVMIHDEERLFIAPLSDISAGGMFVSQLVSIPVGSVVKIVVKGPQWESPLQVEGTVVRVDKKERVGIAVRFTGMSNATKEAIQACIFEMRMEAALKAS